jgi:hypothetical protein
MNLNKTTPEKYARLFPYSVIPAQAGIQLLYIDWTRSAQVRLIYEKQYSRTSCNKATHYTRTTLPTHGAKQTDCPVYSSSIITIDNQILTGAEFHHLHIRRNVHRSACTVPGNRRNPQKQEAGARRFSRFISGGRSW